MKFFRMSMARIISILLILAMMIGVVGCNKNKNPDKGNDDNIGDISAITDDLPRDENGEFDPTYLEGAYLSSRGSL